MQGERERLSPEREAVLRQAPYAASVTTTAVAELLAEIDALRAERDDARAYRTLDELTAVAVIARAEESGYRGVSLQQCIADALATARAEGMEAAAKECDAEADADYVLLTDIACARRCARRIRDRGRAK